MGCIGAHTHHVGWCFRHMWGWMDDDTMNVVMRGEAHWWSHAGRRRIACGSIDGILYACFDGNRNCSQRLLYYDEALAMTEVLTTLDTHAR